MGDVSLTELSPYVVMIEMHDRENKNTFSQGVIQGLLAAFDKISRNSQYRAVILTGYDNYFSSGGTQESLMAIHDGKVKFNVVNIYSLALDCKIPVISAMQGHSIGGGFIMGLFADFVVMSRESIYTANFMRYGFTPGMGATYILPKKLGFSLAHEMLINGRNYRGIDLEKRGIPFPVVPRAEVLGYAKELANELAEKPRISLITLKDHLVQDLRNEIDAVIQKEIAMHDTTFHQEEVKNKIKDLFGQ